jgi:hypothetical protein
MDIIKELDKLIEAYYSEEIDSRDEWLREIICLKDRLAKKNEVLDLVSKSFIIEWDDEYVNRSGTTEYLKCDDIPKAINDFIKENPDNIITGAK